MTTMKIEKGYEVLQDVHSLGEKYNVFDPAFDSDKMFHCISAFEPIEHLAHLQLLFAEQPYFGRELRYFNHAPWWYRVRFDVPLDAEKHAILRVGAADYFADCYLNGIKLGSHEGYFAAFSFQVDDIIKRGETNTLVIRVSAPWDDEIMDGRTKTRFWDIERNQMKGVYEHADTFVQRDVNPIGLWKCAELDFYENAYINSLDTCATLDGTNGVLKVNVSLSQEGCVRLSLIDCEDGSSVASETCNGNTIMHIENVNPWNCVDRGRPFLYELRVDLIENEKVVQSISRHIGFRTIELRRTQERTEYFLNGQRLFIRGTTYFPDIYLSTLNYARYLRDLTAIKAAGMNTVRVHVHVEQSCFYDLCDRMGILVIQDSDLNWVQKRSDEFTSRAMIVFDEMLSMLGHHPSIATWICYNEPDQSHEDYFMNVQPGPQIEALAHKLTPGIPTIRGSYYDKELHSGDSHNYLGSLNGEKTHYLDTMSFVEKFNTEFGIDAPAEKSNLMRVPRLFKRLHMNNADIAEIQEYQFRLLQFYIENYRIHKYDVCGGYVQFMFIDLCPQSFYGVYDWWGVPKRGLDALLTSNQPIAVMLEHDKSAKALWAVNDTIKEIQASLCWTITRSNGEIVSKSGNSFVLPADSRVRVQDFDHDLKDLTLTLTLIDESNKLLAQNKYHDPCCHPVHPKGHPDRIDAEIGVRLFNS